MAVLWVMLYENTKKYELGLFCITAKVYGTLQQFMLALCPHSAVAYVLLSSIPSMFQLMTQSAAMMSRKNLLRE